jgi:AraC-like DNA-binding protein
MANLHGPKALLCGQQSQKHFLHHVSKILEDNIDASPLNVTFLAKSLAVSRSTLNRRLSRLAGTSASELIKESRLKRAIAFLSSGKRVSETAYLSGFETPSYFIHCFKEVYKVTPKKYSKRLLQENDVMGLTRTGISTCQN